MKLKNIKETEMVGFLDHLLEGDQKKYAEIFGDRPTDEVACFIKALICDSVGGDATITSYCYRQFLWFIGGHKARPIRSTYSGGYCNKKDVTRDLYAIIRAAGIAVVYGNDAPRCGVNGDFFKLA